MMRTFKFIALVAGGLLCATICAPAAIAQDDAGADLAKALQASDADACIEACQKLCQLGPAAAPAVADLAKALNTPGNVELQRCAALALGAIGPGAKDAVPVLITTLQSKNAKVRAYSAHALGEIGPGASDAAIPLIDVITDKEPMVRREARDALRRIDAPDTVVLPNIAKILNAADPGDAAAAVMTLSERGEAAVPGLCKALENDEACYWAALALSEIGPKAAGAVPQLAKLLQHKDAEIRMQALVAMAEIGTAARTQVGAINALLGSDPEDGVRYAAAYALGSIGDKSVGREALNEALDSDDPFLKVAGAWALLKLSQGETPLLRKAVKNVVDGLSSDDAHVRLAAARALSDPSIPEGLVAPAFAKAMAGLQADQPEKILPIVDALGSLGPKVVPGCIRSLENKRPLRFYAMQVLIRVGPDAAPAVPALMATLDDSDATLRREALFVLGAIGPGAAAAAEKVAEKLADEDSDVTHAACYALGNMGPAAQAALPALAKQMSSGDEFLQIVSVWASLKINPNDAKLKEKAVPYLAKGLSDVREHVRVESAYMLGEIGAPATAAVPALKKAQSDSSPLVRDAATAALELLQ